MSNEDQVDVCKECKHIIISPGMSYSDARCSQKFYTHRVSGEPRYYLCDSRRSSDKCEDFEFGVNYG